MHKTSGQFIFCYTPEIRVLVYDNSIETLTHCVSLYGIQTLTLIYMHLNCGTENLQQLWDSFAYYILTFRTWTGMWCKS